MTSHCSLLLLATLGTLSAAGAAAADTSAWSCSTCPYPKAGTSGQVEAGVGAVSDASTGFGDHTGLKRSGPFLILGGRVQHRGEGGYQAELDADDLGLDTRSLRAQAGREGRYTLRLGYSETPRQFGEGTATPFIGAGGGVLNLPAGYPAASTASMPLASTLQAIDPGVKRRQLNLGATLLGGAHWRYDFSLRRDTREGTQPAWASFFSTSSQLLAPVDQVHEQLEAAASYQSPLWQGRLAYQLSRFSNHEPALTWQNPFQPVVAGATRGQLALAPDSRLQQVVGTAAMQIEPRLRASLDFAVGRLEQDEAYLAPTLTPALLAAAQPPVSSLGGRVRLFNSGLRLSASPTDALRVNFSYQHDERDNRTAVRSYAQVTTDLFADPQRRSNTPFSLRQDRYRLSADYRASGRWKLSGGVERDDRKRSYTEVVDTAETTVWGRAAVQARDDLSLSLKLAHAERRHSDYGTATWFAAPENPLLRKFNLAARSRDSLSARGDFSVNDKIGLGFSLDLAEDAYRQSLVGLSGARSVNVAVDVSAALTDATQLSAYAQGERVQSTQRGSQGFGAADWTGISQDRFNVLGLNLRHALVADKADIGAELSVSRTRGTTLVRTVLGEPAFPTVSTAVDSLKLWASVKLTATSALNASIAHEQREGQDWRLDGLQPATLGNLLSLGQRSARYNVDVVRLSLRTLF